MAHAYTPGLKVTNRVRHRTRRLLPLPGEVLAEIGSHVQAQDVVAQAFMPGDVSPINLSNALSLPPGDIPDIMTRKEGDVIEVGDVIAVTRGIFGFFKTDYKAKVAGKIETISKVTGQVIVRGEPMPVQVKAYLSGEVVEVLPQEGVAIENEVSLIQGIFGIGGETCGPIRMACESHNDKLTLEKITSEMKGAVVIGGARMTGEAVQRAIEVGAVAVVSGGMDDQDLRQILGYDLGVAITGSEKIGLTLIITEGFGDISMAAKTFELFKTREGDEASVNGSTQIRAGVMRPEIIIPLSESELASETESVHSSGMLDVGTTVRIIRDPWFGLIGSVTGLPTDPTTLGSGSKARVLDVKMESGETVTVPRANVELIEE